MAEADRDLLVSLARLRKRARAVRGVRLSGRALLALAVALLALFVAREFARGEWGVELLPFTRFRLILLTLAAFALALGAAVVGARLGGPDVAALARGLDRRRETRDLLAAGLAARREVGPLAREVLRRAGALASTFDPAELFPARRSLAKTLAVVPILLLAVYLLGISPGTGALPSGGTSPAGGGSEAAAPAPGAAPGAGPSVAEPPPEPERPEDPDPGATPPAVAEEILARLVPAKRLYEPGDPVTLFVQAKPGGELSRAHEFEISLDVDGERAPARTTVTVGPAAGDDGLAVVFARSLPELAGKLGPGKHRVAAVLREGESELRTPEVEIEIRGDPGGSPPPKPEPKPGPGPGGQPPPAVEPRPRFVTPLFGPGETRPKEGWALVPDPEAPPGTPPRRLPLDEAAREASRRAESDVPVESPRPGDRELIRRYFDALREGR